MPLRGLSSPSFASTYRREAARALARRAPTPVVTEADLARVPALLRTYLRRVGVVGRPLPRNLRARFRGALRNGEHGPWMNVRVEQTETFDPPARLFLVRATRLGVPVEALHVYEGGAARMQVRLASLFDLIDAHGPEMNRSETVTLFNDLCMLSPANLLRAAVTWREVDERRLAGTFTNAGNVVGAELSFDAAGDLVDFVSHDRAESADGRTFRVLPWSTPMRDFRDYHWVRLASHGDAVWREPDGTDFVYARFDVEDVEYDVAA